MKTDMYHNFYSQIANFHTRARRLLVFLFCAFLVSACSTPSPNIPLKVQTDLTLKIEANSGVNPDEKGVAEPIMVRVYELKSTNTFESADYFSLENDGKNLLGNDALVTNDYIIRPGDSKIIVRKSNPDTVAIGVLASYRDLGKSVWRYVWVLPPTSEPTWYHIGSIIKKAKLNIYLGKQAVSITELEK